MSEQLSVRPHARLLTMLGEQLIRNDRIALVEIIKNAYDADARNVLVNFTDFGEDFRATPASTISVLDDGVGMIEHVVKTDWLNPASPGKLRAKRSRERTPLGRTMQGEKGIGRFAIFKLGRIVELVTKPAEEPFEYVVTYDISELDEDLIGAGSSASEDLYLDELPVKFVRRAPRVFGVPNRPASGTRLKIGGLRSRWSAADRQAAFQDVLKLRPISWTNAADTEGLDDFRVRFLVGGKEDLSAGNPTNELNRLITQRSVLRVENGKFDDAKREFTFKLNGQEQVLSLDSPTVRAIRAFKNQFVATNRSSTECGSFGFSFFVFDFSSKAPPQYRLEKDEKKALKEHRVYLYRDGIRVYPYGDQEDDWLHIDATRGTQGAGRMFSNDQVVGYVAISQAGNPQLRDKTNREGLVDAGRATSDFVALIQTLLAHLRADAYSKYILDNHGDARRSDPPPELDTPLRRLAAAPDLPAEVRDELERIANAYDTERTYFEKRSSRTEDLAAVGLSVESASHDIIAAMNESLRAARKLDDDLYRISALPGYVRTEAKSLVTKLEFVSARLQDIQGLFVSTRQIPQPYVVAELAARVEAIYSRLLTENRIEVEYEGDASTFEGLTTEAALLQLFVNLFDNALYWLSSTDRADRKIRIAFDSDRRAVLFEDNGPGVREVDLPYIFEAFYSGKGEAGRGLGLYIAREVGLRNGFDLEAVNGPLGGAAFEITFAEESKS